MRITIVDFLHHVLKNKVDHLKPNNTLVVAVKIMQQTILVLSDSLGSNLLANKINEEVNLVLLLPSPPQSLPYYCINHWLKWKKSGAEKFLLALELGFEDYVFWNLKEELSASYYAKLKQLSVASRGGSRKLVNLFCEFIDTNKAARNHGFYNACVGGHMEIVKMMIDKGADAWNWGIEGACVGGNIEIVELIISKNGPILNWNFALTGACYNGNIELIELMITKGGRDWDYGLAGACDGGHIEIVKIMIDKGAKDFRWCFRRVCQPRRELLFSLCISDYYYLRWQSALKISGDIIIDLLLSKMEQEVSNGFATWDIYISYIYEYENELANELANKLIHKKMNSKLM